MATMTLNNNDRLLRRIMRFDSLMCIGSGVLLLVGAQPLASLLGVSNQVSFLAVVGIILIACGALIGWGANQTEIDRRFAMLVIGVNVLWVIGSFALLVSNALPFNDLGKWAVVLQADAVGVVALIEFVGLRRMVRG